MARQTVAAVRKRLGSLRKLPMAAYSTKKHVYALADALMRAANLDRDASLHVSKYYLQRAAEHTMNGGAPIPIHHALDEVRAIFGPAEDMPSIETEELTGGGYFDSLLNKITSGARALAEHADTILPAAAATAAALYPAAGPLVVAAPHILKAGKTLFDPEGERIAEEKAAADAAAARAAKDAADGATEAAYAEKEAAAVAKAVAKATRDAARAAAAATEEAESIRQAHSRAVAEEAAQMEAARAEAARGSALAHAAKKGAESAGARARVSAVAAEEALNEAQALRAEIAAANARAARAEAAVAPQPRSLAELIRAPKTPRAPRAVPRAPRAPKAPKASRTPRAPKAPKTPAPRRARRLGGELLDGIHALTLERGQPREGGRIGGDFMLAFSDSESE